MTTVAQVKPLVQVTLARNRDLVLVKRCLVLTPVKHIFRSILIDHRSGVGQFMPMWFSNPLFKPISFLGGLGNFLDNKGPGMTWNLNVPGIEEILADRIEEVVLPMLRPIETIEQFNAFALDAPFFGGSMRHNIRTRAYVEAALGNFGFADEAISMMKARLKEYAPEHYEVEQFEELIGPFHAAIRAGDRTVVASYLHKWEAYTVRNAKLEKFWQPSPFPIELNA